MQVQDTVLPRKKRNGGIQKPCDYCGEPFMARTYLMKLGRAHCCSGNCTARLMRSEYERGLTASHTDFAYLAGMIDGEGCITINRSRAEQNSRSPRHRLRLYVVNISRPLIDWLIKTFGGRFHPYPKPTGRVVLAWCAPDVAVEILIRHCLPYMIVKREQASLALQFRPPETLQTGLANTPEELSRRDAIWARMCALNRPGGKSKLRQNASLLSSI